MTKNRSTKRALLMSALALVMCFAMLIGSTFAWFTDSVTSAGNKIKAGNLDVELHMFNGTEYVDISNSVNPIFGAEDSLSAQNVNADTLWEPGKTQVAYLKIVNNGSLALKYTVGLDVTNVSKNLYKVMKYDIVENATNVAPVTAWNGGNSVVEGVQSVSGDVSLAAGGEHYFALAIHMDESAGNEYQNGQVNFDLTILATQDTVEADSFNELYDKDATYPAVGTETVPDNATTPTTLKAGAVSVEIPTGASGGFYKLNVTNKREATEASGASVLAFDIDLYKDGVKVQPEAAIEYSVEIEVGKDKRILGVTHNGYTVYNFDYDVNTGIVSFTTSSFSPFAIRFDTFRNVTGLSGQGTEADPYLINDYYDLCWFRDNVNTCASDGSSQYTNKHIKLTADIDLCGENWEPIGSTTKDHGSFYGNFNGDGHTIKNLYVELGKGEGAAGFFAKVSGGGDDLRAVVRNLVFENVDVSSQDGYVGGIIGNAGGNSLVENVTVKGDVYVLGQGGYVGGIVGHGYPDMYNCKVDANEGSYIMCYYWCSGGIIGYAGEGGTYLENCSVNGVYIYSSYGAAGALAGLLQSGNTVKDCYAENVEINTNSSYACGYACGNGEEGTYNNVWIKDVTVTVAGKPLSEFAVDGSGYHNTDNKDLIVK